MIMMFWQTDECQAFHRTRELLRSTREMRTLTDAPAHDRAGGRSKRAHTRIKVLLVSVISFIRLKIIIILIGH